jgi:hypothetical protein
VATTYQQKLRVTTGSLPSGNYLIHWSCEWYDDTGGINGAVRVQINDSTTVAEFFNYDDYTYNYRLSAGVYYASSISGVQNIDMDYKAASGSILYIRRARIVVYRMS